MLIYLKGLEQEIDILPPAELGGLKSSEYCALNPQACQLSFDPLAGVTAFQTF